MTYDEALKNLDSVLGDHVTRLNNFRLDKIVTARNIEALKKDCEDAVNKLSIGNITFEYSPDRVTACYTPSGERTLRKQVRTSDYSPRFDKLEVVRVRFHDLLTFLFIDIVRTRERAFAELSTTWVS